MITLEERGKIKKGGEKAANKKIQKSQNKSSMA